MTRREIGIVGLGRMGGGLALQALEKGIRVVGLDARRPPHALVEAGCVTVQSYVAFAAALAPPRVVLVYVPAGAPVDRVLDELAAVLDPADAIADGGNSYWRDSVGRADRLARKSLLFCDVGTSGGVEGARHGACFMVGGEAAAVARVEPILTALAVPGGYLHAGPLGAGHFTKLVHNGIEFGMLQAIGEGVALLKSYRDPLDVERVVRCWRHGSVIQSRLLDLLDTTLRGGMPLHAVPSYVEDTGEVNWLVSDAMDLEVPVPVIAQAVMALVASRDETRDAARAVAMIRHAFGGHPLGPDPAVAHERHTGRIDDTMSTRTRK